MSSALAASTIACLANLTVLSFCQTESRCVVQIGLQLPILLLPPTFGICSLCILGAVLTFAGSWGLCAAARPGGAGSCPPAGLALTVPTCLQGASHFICHQKLQKQDTYLPSF